MALIVKWSSAPHAFLKAHRRCMHSDRQKPQSCSTRQLHDQTLWPRGPCPSPHEILKTGHGIPYSKKHFHRLVKLYHPDLCALNENDLAGISRATSIERYRLVIEANEILSDPQKRMLYEKYGLGWASSKQRSRQAPRSSHAAGAYETYDSKSSAQQAGSERQFPIFAPNAMVAIFLVAMAMAGAVMQLERARKAQWDFKERDAALQKAISRDLQDLAELLEGKPRDMRILEFLARRELNSWTRREAPFEGFDEDENICRH